MFTKESTNDFGTDIPQPPALPKLRLFVVKRNPYYDPNDYTKLLTEDTVVEAHTYDATDGIARFYVLSYEQIEGHPQLVQYLCRAFKEWYEVEEILVPVVASGVN